MSYVKRVKKREQIVAEQQCLGNALLTLQKMCERIRMTDTKWLYLEDDEQQELIEEISHLAIALKKTSECGRVTWILHHIGSNVFQAARPKQPWGSKEALTWWSDKSLEVFAKDCEFGKKKIERRLSEITSELSEPAPVPLNHYDLIEQLFPKHYQNLDVAITKTLSIFLKITISCD